jgi:ketosteroid isomerase-like protein
VEKKEKNPNPFAQPMNTPVSDAELQDVYRRIQPEMRREKPSADAIAAAMEAVQRLAAEADAEGATADFTQDLTTESKIVACKICGYQNRESNKFCGMCGGSVEDLGKVISGTATRLEAEPKGAFDLSQRMLPEPERPAMTRPVGNETHHYHHHYHHHYFPGSPEGAYPRAVEPARDPVRDAAREDKLRSTAAALRGDLSRAEASVRAITQEWVLACNTKHLDDLLELYSPDALVLRSNYPPIRGAAAVREFFFGILDAGLGEVEIEPLRVDVVGELAYEAGRCKALIPGSTGKRREERGKYLWVLQRQPNNEWKLVADCWSSDLTLTTLESDLPAGAAVKTSVPRKNP